MKFSWSSLKLWLSTCNHLVFWQKIPIASFFGLQLSLLLMAALTAILRRYNYDIRINWHSWLFHWNPFILCGGHCHNLPITNGLKFCLMTVSIGYFSIHTLQTSDFEMYIVCTEKHLLNEHQKRVRKVVFL